MNAYLRSHLGAKLFLSYLAIIVVGVMVLILTSQFILPASFNRHMAGMGNGMMMGQTANSAMSQLYVDFRASFNEALMYAALAAMVAAILLSFLFSRGVISPVQAMSVATQRIANGRYEERVQVKGEDERFAFHTGDRQNAPQGFIQSSQALLDDSLNAERQRLPIQCVALDPFPLSITEDVAAFLQYPQQFNGEERMPPGPAEQPFPKTIIQVVWLRVQIGIDEFSTIFMAGCFQFQNNLAILKREFIEDSFQWMLFILSG